MPLQQTQSGIGKSFKEYANQVDEQNLSQRPLAGNQTPSQDRQQDFFNENGSQQEGVGHINRDSSIREISKPHSKQRRFSNQKPLINTRSIPSNDKVSRLSREKKLPAAKTFTYGIADKYLNESSKKFLVPKNQPSSSLGDEQGAQLQNMQKEFEKDPKQMQKKLLRNVRFQSMVDRANDDDRDAFEKALDNDDFGNQLFNNVGIEGETEEQKEKQEKRKMGKRKLHKKINFLIRSSVILAFTVVFVFGVIIYAVTALKPNHCVGYIATWKFLVVLGVVGPVYVFSYIASKLLLVVFKLMLAPRYYWYFVIPLRHQFRIFLMICLEWITVAVLVNRWRDGECAGQRLLYSYQDSVDTIYRSFLSILLFVICNLLKRLITKVFAARDRGTAQFQRGLESLFAEFVIIVLHTPQDEQESTNIDTLVMQWHVPLIQSLEDPEFSQLTYVRDALQKHIELHTIKFFDDVVTKDKGEKQLKKAAKKITLRIFKNLSGNENEESKQYITKRDFATLFPPAILDRAYRMFDRDGNGEVNREETEMVVEKIFNDRLNLKKTIQDQNNIYGKLENIIGLVLFVIVGLTILIIFQANLGNIWAIFTGSAAIVSLVLAEPIKRFVESIIFIFLIRPFDVGDWIQIEKEVFVVQEMHLLDMVLKRNDGQKFYYPNNQLYTVRIINLTKSDGEIDGFNFVTDMDTRPEVLEELFKELQQYVAMNPQDHHDFFVTQMVPSTVPHKVMVQIFIQYKENMRDGIRMLGMKTRFFQHAMEELSKRDIHFTIPSSEEVLSSAGNLQGSYNQQQQQGYFPPQQEGQGRNQPPTNPNASLI